MAEEEVNTGGETYITDSTKDSVVLDYPDGIPIQAFIGDADHFVTRSIRRNAQGKIYHFGIDIAVVIGTPIAIPFRGTVLSRGTEPKGGKFVEFAPFNSLFTFTIRHLSKFGNTGSDVPLDPGTILAYSGNSGSRTTGPHLHMEIRYNGKIIDPRHVLVGEGGKNG